MKRRAHQEWLELFEQHRCSGLSIKAFCQENQLNPNYFSKRRRELQSPNPVDSCSPFVQLRSGDSRSAAIAVSIGYVQIKLSPQVSPEWLAVFVKALA